MQRTCGDGLVCQPPLRQATFLGHPGLPTSVLVRRNCREVREQRSTFDLPWSKEGERAPTGLWLHHLPAGPGGSDKNQSNLPSGLRHPPRIWDSKLNL